MCATNVRACVGLIGCLYVCMPPLCALQYAGVFACALYLPSYVRMPLHIAECSMPKVVYKPPCLCDVEVEVDDMASAAGAN